MKWVLILHLGAFTNYVCTWGWVGGQQNAYLCLHRVRGSFENVYVNKTKNCEFFTFSLFYIYTELCRGSQSCFWDFHINLKEKIVTDSKNIYILNTSFYNIIHIYWKFEQFWVEIYLKNLVRFASSKHQNKSNLSKM